MRALLVLPLLLVACETTWREGASVTSSSGQRLCAKHRMAARRDSRISGSQRPQRSCRACSRSQSSVLWRGLAVLPEHHSRARLASSGVDSAGANDYLVLPAVPERIPRAVARAGSEEGVGVRAICFADLGRRRSCHAATVSDQSARRRLDSQLFSC